MAILSVITVKLVAMGLSKELAGNYNSVYGYLQIFGILADFGLYAVAVREVSRAQDKPAMMGSLIILRSIIMIISLVSALLIAWIMPAWQGTPLPIGISIAALTPFFTLLAGIQRTVFQVTYKMHYVFIAEVTMRIITVSLIAGVIILYGVRNSYELWAYQAFLWAGVVGTFVLFALSTYFAHTLMKIRLRWDSAQLKHLLMLAAPYGAAFLCTALYRQTDITLIAVLRPDYEIQNAYYGFALRCVEMAYLFPTFLLNSTLPILSERDDKGEDTRAFVGKIFFAIILLGTTIALFSLFWARPVMGLLTTEQYLSNADHAGSDTALMLLALPMLLNGIVLFSFYSLLTKHEWRPLVTTLAFGALFSLGLNVMLIPQYGFVGSCIGSIATHLFLAILLLPQSLKVLPMELPRAQIKQWVIYTLVLGGGLMASTPFLTSNVMTVIGLALATLLIAAIAHLTGILKILRI
jgi:O-antigen/teichoic acid export membrane protein